MEKRWEFKNLPTDNDVKQLSASLNINTTLATLLLQRGIESYLQAKAFFRPRLDQLHDPFLMKDMEKAVNRLCDAIGAQEKIMIYGDYDVDGTTSVSVVYGFLKAYCQHIEYYIPDRYTEGYGVSEKGIRYAHEQGIQLIITLDCGIRAVNMTHLANELGIDMIIGDHHLPGEELPAAHAVLDPKRSDCEYPYKELSGCGVGFKLLQGFCIQNTIPLQQLYQFLDLVAVSIASDIVPITGENRILAYYGLQKINQAPSKGLKALLDISGIRGAITISDIVFYIGPRINAAGRLSHAKESVRLLLAEDADDLDYFSENLNTKNAERKQFDQDITSEALEMIATNPQMTDAKSTVLFKENWHKGVIGIVASRCIEHYYRPTIILTESKSKATGSARSVDGFDIYTAISECSDLLEQFGGHTHAAGLTLSVDNVSAFQQKFEEVVAASISEEELTPKLTIDMEVALDFIKFKTYHILQQMAPFGPQNLQPIFVSKNLQCKIPPRLLKDKHLKLRVYQNDPNLSFDAIGFGMPQFYERIANGETFHMAYHIGENNFQGNKTLQLMIKDIKFDA